MWGAGESNPQETSIVKPFNDYKSLPVPSPLGGGPQPLINKMTKNRNGNSTARHVSNSHLIPTIPGVRRRNKAAAKKQ